jgi:hypothetical protein
MSIGFGFFLKLKYSLRIIFTGNLEKYIVWMLADIVVNFMIGGLLIWRLIIKGFSPKNNNFFQFLFILILEVDIFFIKKTVKNI